MLELDALIFDSGLGGLSVTSEMRLLMKDRRFAYVADNAALPYGNKTEVWLLERVLRVIAAALEQVQPKVMVIACNTASTLVLPALRARYPQAIVGVVPAIKPAAAQSRSRVIGLLATPATIKRSYTETLIQEFAADCRVIRVGSSELVELAEAKLRGHPPSLALMQSICAPLLAHPELDTLVLGCTHFPLLTPELQKILPQVRILDSGSAIALRVKQLLDLEGGSVLQESAEEPAYFTALETGEILAETMASYGFHQTHKLKLPPI